MEYDVRKNKILDTAQDLFYSLGYDQTTIEVIITEARIAKGTFYYYFKSKLDLLEKLIDRMTNKILDASKPIIESKAGTLEKFRKLFDIAGAIKFEHREMLISAFTHMSRDEDLISRHKMARRVIEKLSPVYGAIIKQGVEDGIFNTPYPDEVGELILNLWYSMSDVAVGLLLGLEEKPENLKILKTKLRIFVHATERILGAEIGSMDLFDWQKIDDFIALLRKSKGVEDDKDR